MKKHPIVAFALALTMAASTVPALFAQQSTTLAGTAKDEAKRPYTDYSARARSEQGVISDVTKLTTEGNFSLPGLGTDKYFVELLNKDGKVVCVEGPFDMTKQAVKNDVVVDCGKFPAAWWLVVGAAAAGITAGVIALDDASPSR